MKADKIVVICPQRQVHCPYYSIVQKNFYSDPKYVAIAIIIKKIMTYLSN